MTLRISRSDTAATESNVAPPSYSVLPDLLAQAGSSQDEPRWNIALPPSPSEESPPSYSLTPDLDHGEQTVELGSLRRSQRQARALAQPQTMLSPSSSNRPPALARPSSSHSTGNPSPPPARPPGAELGWSPGFIPQQPRRPQPVLTPPASYPGAEFGWPKPQRVLIPPHSRRSSSPESPERPRPPGGERPPGEEFGWGPGFKPQPPNTRPPMISANRSVPNLTPGNSNSQPGLDFGWGPEFGASSSRNRPEDTQAARTTSASDVMSSRSTSGNLSGFARDFYAAGAPQNVEEQRSPPRDTSPLSQRGSPTNSTPGPSVPDDRKPTATPVPGHPLLKGNRVLVYSPSYECYNCARSYLFVIHPKFIYKYIGHNTGYKNYNNASPCFACWESYAQPFRREIFNAPRDPSAVNGNYQKPLPVWSNPRLAEYAQTVDPHFGRSSGAKALLGMFRKGS